MILFPDKKLEIPKKGMTFEQRLDETLALVVQDPLDYVMLAFPWGEDPVLQKVKLPSDLQEIYGVEYGPDQWAIEFLLELSDEIKKRRWDTETAVEPIRFSTASGHGIGKSTLVAWLIKFILDTRPYSKGVVTAGTAEQLRTKTWAELAKWNAASITAHRWVYNNSRGNMSLYWRGNKDTAQNWRCDALTCKEENSESFAGLHAAGGTPFYIFDEASGIPDPIFEVRQGGATDGSPMWFDFGNPTRKTGYFFENTIGRYRHRYITRTIDSRSVAITNKAVFQELIDDYGEDSDIVKVRVKGEFPAQGSMQFISDELVEEAMLRPLPEQDDKAAALIIGVDVARFGDDLTVLFPRIGNDARSFKARTFSGLDNVQVAEQVIEMIEMFSNLGKKVDGLFIDGGGLGGGVVDILRRLGYNPIDVQFQSKAGDRRYRARVDEMWGRLKDALPYLCLPQDTRLRRQLTQREYDYNLQGAIQLESKRQMKERGLESPDVGDALALTYTSRVAKSIAGLIPKVGPQVIHEYDPFAEKL